MKNIMTKLTNIVLFLLTTNYLYAAPSLPVSKQSKKEKVEISDEIKIQVETPTKTKNSKLKQGNACSDEHLEEAKGELIVVVEIPMAKTIPCDKVNCKDLPPAKLHKDNTINLKIAETISCDK